MSIPGPINPVPTDPRMPQVDLPPGVWCSAGTEAGFEVTVTHRGTEPALLTLTVLGLDTRWAPEPATIGPLDPGQSAQVTLTLVPERGALGARYPFVVAAEARSRRDDRPVMGVGESVLTVDARERLVVAIVPPQVTAVFGKRADLQITNPGSVDRALTLTADDVGGAVLRLSENSVLVPAGATSTVRGRIKVRHPRLFGSGGVHAVGVTVRDAAAPEHAGGTVRSRPLIRNGLRAGVILGLVLALWVAAAVVFIPMLSDRFTARNKVNSATASAQTTGTAPTGTAGTGATGTGSNAPGTADSDANGTGPGSADGDTDGSGDTGVPGAGAASGGQTRLAGTITGPVSTGVIVKVESTSLADAANAGAAPADTGSSGQGLRDAMAAIGKVPASALTVAPTDGCPAAQTTKTGSDGAFAFSCLTSRGFYLVTFAHQGFSEQRFIVDGSTLADAEPMKVVLSPDNGKLSGTVTGPDGPVGAATVAITDGTLSLTTSTVSRGGQGTAGSWAVTNLSTPGTYLITISAPGLGTVSMLRTLKAGGTATADATMKAGVATILGTISGTDEFGVPGPLGGVTVTATDGTTTRTATTVTTGSVGSYALPDLPSPGSYTLTVAGNGFQTATRVVDIPEGAGGVQADVSLDRTNGTVAGTVNAKEGGTLAGVGLTLTGKDATYKTISQTSPKGQFSFTGVTPGEYVLTADLFGRVPASVNVTVTAAGTTTANLTMASDNLAAVVRTSDIAVRVVDNRSGAALRCDRQPVGEHKGCLVSISGLVPEHPGTDDPDPRPVAVKEAGSLLQHTWPDSPTLPAGLYQLTVSAPGFESAQVAVQVQEGVTATAPEVRLQPLGMVAGTVTTRVGTPADPSCAVAFRTSTEQAEAPTRCTVTARPGQKPNKTCEATAPSGTTVFDCAVVDPAKGTYSLPGLSHGGYQIRIIPTDPEYQATEPASVQLGFGEDATVNAVLDRLGRLTVTTLAPDLATSSLSPAGGAEVVVTPATGARPGLTTSGTTSAKGEFQATGLLGRYTVVASGTAGRGTVVVPSVGLNQSSTVTVVLTRAIGPVVGRVTTTVDAVTRPVHGAEATVTGVSGFNGSTAIIGTAVVTTDANGCFAIVPAGWGTEPVASTAAECPAVAGSAVTVADADGADVSFVTRPLTIDIGRAGTRTQARVFSDVLASAPDAQGVRSLPAMIVSAQPSVFGRHTITGRSADGTAAVELSTLVFTITRKPAGAGDVTISAQSGGALTFRDSTQDKDNAVVPGRYTVVARDRGFADASFVLTCELGEQCVLTQDDDDAVDDNLVLFQLPTMTGELTLSALPPGKSSGYIDDAKVVPVSAPPAAGTVKVDLVNSACSAGAGDPCRIMEFHDSKQNVGLAVPGTYVFSVALQGFADQQISVTCGTDFRHPCTSLSLELGRYPKFGGTVVLSPTTFPDGSAPSRDDVRVDVLSKPNSGGSVAIDVDAGGVMHWTDTTLPAGLMAPGTYTLQFTLNGYRIDPVTFTCPTTAEQCTLDGAVGEDDPPSVQTMLMLPSGSGQVLYDYSPPDVAVPFTDAAVTVAGPAGTSNLRVRLDETGTLVWTDPVIGIAGLTQPGHYSIGIQIPGYSAVTVTLDCAFGKVCTSTTPTATRMPEVDGTASLAGGGDLALLKTATFEVKGAGASVTLTSDDTGKLTWQEAGWPTNLIRPGTYQITPRLSGYDAEALTFTCTAPTPPLTAAPTCKETLAVKFYLAGHFEISLQDQAGQAVTGATLTLSGTRITTVTARGTVNPQVFGPMPTLPAATYTIKVAAPGFRFLTYDADSTAVVCTGSTNGLRLQSGGTTACKITLSPAGTILGKVLSRVTATPPVTDSALFGATVTACLLNASSDSACDPKAPSFPATSDSDGLVAVTGNADTEGLGPGTWLVTASSPGAAKVSGTVQITDDYAMTEPPAGSINPLTIKDGRVQLILEVTPIDLTVTPQGALGAAVLPAGTYTLSGANGHWTCVVPTPDPDDGQPCTINTTTSRFTFTGVNPGTYDLTGTAPNPARPTFQTATIPVTVQLAVDSALATQQVALPLTMRSSVLTIRVLRTTTDDTDWVSGATVVVSHQNQTAPAQDLNGKDLTTGAGGPVLTRDPADPKHAAQVAFPDVEDATYTVWVTVPGYAPMSAAVSLIAANNPTPPAQIFTLSRAARSIVVALASTAAGTVSFEGASVTLHQTAGPGGTTPTDNDITGLTVSGGFVSASQVPTGVWQVRVVDRQPGGPSAPPAAWAAVSLGTITVPNLTSPTDIAPVTGSQLIGQGQVNLSVSWAKNTCTDTSGPAAGSTIKVRIANGGNNIEVPLTVATSGNSYTATGSVLLPGRTSAYTWTTEDLPAGWTDATGSFSITVAANAVGGSVPPVSSSGTAKPATVPAGITLTVSGAGTLPSATVTATRTGSPDTAGPLTYGTPTAGTTVGTASLCLAPVAGWKLSVASGSILLPDKTNQTVAESGTSIFDFPGATLTPTVVLDTVTGRTSDTRTVAVDVIRAGSPIWHESAALTGTTPWTGSTLILPSGSYTVRGTPPAADAFDPGSGTVDLATTHTVTATLPYVKAMFTVAVTTSTDAVAVGASVSLDGGAERTVDSAGKVLYADLAPGTHSIKATLGTTRTVSHDVPAGVSTFGVKLPAAVAGNAGRRNVQPQSTTDGQVTSVPEPPATTATTAPTAQPTPPPTAASTAPPVETTPTTPREPTPTPAVPPTTAAATTTTAAAAPTIPADPGQVEVTSSAEG